MALYESKALFSPDERQLTLFRHQTLESLT